MSTSAGPQGVIYWCEEFFTTVHPYLTLVGTGTETQAVRSNNVTAGGGAENGVLRLGTAGSNGDSAGLVTPIAFQPSKCFYVDATARIRLPDNDDNVVFGFADVNGTSLDVDDIMTSTATLITPVASDFAVIQYDEDYATKEFRYAYRGGRNNSPTDASENLIGIAKKDNGWQTLRVRIHANGQAEFWLTGDEKSRYYSVKDAIDPDVQFAAILVIQAESAAAATLDVDFFEFSTYRDWGF